MGPFDYPQAGMAAYGSSAGANPAYRKMWPPQRMPPQQMPPRNWGGGRPLPPTQTGGQPGFLGPPTPYNGPSNGAGGASSGSRMPPLPPTGGVGSPNPGQGWVDAGYGTGGLVNGFQRANQPQVANDGGMAGHPPIANDAGMGNGITPGPTYGSPSPYPPNQQVPVSITGQSNQPPMPPVYGQPWQRRPAPPYMTAGTGQSSQQAAASAGNPYAGIPRMMQ